ncbi:hypothetical protein C5167_000721 [Papaver somniferum]|uniref:Generative cell specific-1/HAP2 domain-containing protein n=1 Tax=Papaver somniferum TaxID=3469 RepID=A0A4Y7KVF0_PAPSO|nr:hypothetical protein C5167_000721 [Papaver somniferum]
MSIRFHVFSTGKRSLGFTVRVEVKKKGSKLLVVVAPDNRTVSSAGNLLRVRLIGDFAGYKSIPSFEDFFLRYYHSILCSFRRPTNLPYGFQADDDCTPVCFLFPAWKKAFTGVLLMKLFMFYAHILRNLVLNCSYLKSSFILDLHACGPWDIIYGASRDVDQLMCSINKKSGRRYHVLLIIADGQLNMREELTCKVACRMKLDAEAAQNF